MKNLVGVWLSLARAIEIAKTGNYSISVYFDNDYKNGFEDYEMIKEFYKGFFDKFKKDGDLFVEINKPYTYEPYTKFETLEDIQKRIEKSLSFNKPEIILNSASLSILKHATEKLDLNLKQVEKIKEVSAIIAQIELSKTIEAIHVAEAIQYSYTNIYDTYLFAENKSISFGDMISIKLGEIDNESIDNAINYLNNLKSK